MSQWFYTPDNKQRFGPVTAEQLLQLALSGTIRPDFMVRPEEGGKWVPAAKVKGLFPKASRGAPGQDGAAPPPNAELAAPRLPSPGPANPPGRSRLLLVASLVAGGLLVLCTGSCGIGLMSDGWLWNCAATGHASPKPAVSRQQFERAVMHKTRDEVIDAVGRPDRTESECFGNPFGEAYRESRWYYYRRTLDPASGREDPAAMVEFRGASPPRCITDDRPGPVPRPFIHSTSNARKGIVVGHKEPCFKCCRGIRRFGHRQGCRYYKPGKDFDTEEIARDITLDLVGDRPELTEEALEACYSDDTPIHKGRNTMDRKEFAVQLLRGWNLSRRRSAMVAAALGFVQGDLAQTLEIADSAYEEGES